MTINKGEYVAFVGVRYILSLNIFLFLFSGSGKSTIVQLLERFYDADSGSILIDSIDIKDIQL